MLIFEVEGVVEPADGTATGVPAERWSARGFLDCVDRNACVDSGHD